MPSDIKRWSPLSLESLRTTSLEDRPSKVKVADFGRSWIVGRSFSSFIDGLPNILAGKLFREAIDALARAIAGRRTVILGMGAHPIKVGLNPILVDAIDKGYFTGLACNGAVVIHDVELALVGKTSEDVAAHLERGEFGVARETAEFIHEAVKDGYRSGQMGFGETVGKKLLLEQPPYAHLSVLAQAAEKGIPVTVHVALGTDIIHMHPLMDGAATGALSYRDFRLLCKMVASLQQGVYINLGSAVVLPEVFLKAVSVAANLGYSLQGLTTINMDFKTHYRPMVNVLERPTSNGGKGVALVGHHEIMFPLLMAALGEQLKRGSGDV